MVEEQGAKADGGAGTMEPTDPAPGLTYPPRRTDDPQDEEASFKQEVVSLLLCAVCHETVTDPRQLNCGHFFCAECVELLTVDDVVKCINCSVTTPVVEPGVRVDELASKLVALLVQFASPAKKELSKGDDELAVPLMVNGENQHKGNSQEMPEFGEDASDSSEDEEDLISMTATPDVNETSEPEVQRQSHDVNPVHPPVEPTEPIPNPPENPEVQHVEQLPNPPEDPEVEPAEQFPKPPEDPEPALEEQLPTPPEDLEVAPVENTSSTPETPVVEPTELIPNPPENPEVEFVDQTPDSAANSEAELIQIIPNPPNDTAVDPTEPILNLPEEPRVQLTEQLPNPPESPQVEPTKQMQCPPKEPEIEPAEVIIDPPTGYQSPGEDDDESLPPPPSPPIEVEVHEATRQRQPVEHDATETAQKIENTPESAGLANDETDRKMKASEMKPSDVAISIDMERQCGDCHSTKCTCNCDSTLLTPPVSNGSQLSVETNASNTLSDDSDLEILVQQRTKFAVKASASHVEVANKNRIYVTRWTYDEDGEIGTFDINGNRIKKFISGGRHNYSGITLSKLGFIFALNTSKNRLEEYSGIDGKKVKHFKLDMCRDPQAVDIMPTGEIVVIDQDRNTIIVYPNSKKTNAKPRCIKHELIKDPHDIATTHDGFYITCERSRCLLKLDLEGNLIWSYGGSGEAKSKLKVPKGVCVDESGLVYVIDHGCDAIFVFNKDGDLKGRISEKNKGVLKSPWYVSVRDGIMAVLFQHNIVKTYEFA